MSNILLKVENAGAERLWNYIIAYRRMIGKPNSGDEPSQTKSNVLLGLMPQSERIKTATKPKRNVKKYL
jgi:hypothetical protein